MNSIISITEIANLPDNQLAIIEDTNDGICLGIKSNSIDISNIEFKAKNLFIDNHTAYTFLIKSNLNDIYKCIVPLDNEINKNSVYKLISLDRFNLIVFRKENEQDIYRIENTNKNKLHELLYTALTSQKESTDNANIEDFNNLYTNEQLWNS